MGKVILLTGAPATGKSTLRKRLVAMLPDLIGFDYGALLLEKKADEGNALSYEMLRNQSSAVISPSDVYAMDEKVIEEVTRLRVTSNLILDSHAVTRETYGFRAKTYSLAQLTRLRLDAVLVLRCDPDLVVERISRDGQGRRAVSIELAREHQLLQESVGITYATACGCAFFVLDTSALSVEDVSNQALSLLSSVLGS